VLRPEEPAHAVDEEHAGQHQPHLHRHRDVEDHRQRESADEDGAVRKAELVQARELAPLAHVPGHEEQDAGQRRQRRAGPTAASA
jgi:hypothetical protein